MADTFLPDSAERWYQWGGAAAVGGGERAWVLPNPMLMFMAFYQVCLHSKIILGY